MSKNIEIAKYCELFCCVKHEIFINGYIGDIFDLFGDGNNFTLNKLNESLASAPDATEIVVHINSGGGLVSEGFAIYDKLVSLGIPVTTIVEGMCGSIATVIAQAGKTGSRKMFQNSEYFIHNPMWIPQGPDAHTADDLAALQEDLRKSEDKLINFYVNTTGANREDLAVKMKAETTLTSAEAKALGFIDEVINTDVVAMVKYRIAAAVQPTTKQNNTIMTELEKKFTAGIAKLETLFAAFKGKTVNATVKTTEGVDIYFDGTLDVGSKVFADAAMTVPAPNGEHTFDGKVYTVVGGVVTEVQDVVVAKTDLEIANEKIAALEAQITAATQAATVANTEKEQILAQAEELKTEFINFKNTIKTGVVDFGNPGADKEGNKTVAKKTGMAAVVEARLAKEKANAEKK